MAHDSDPLQAILENLGGQRGQRLDSQAWTSFGDVEGEILQVREAVGLAIETTTGSLILEGPDRVRFLEGQCTQHVAQYECGQGGYGFVLEANGKVVSDVVLLADKSAIFLEVPQQRREALMAWLGRFALLSDVDLVDATAQTTLLRMTGPGTEEALSSVAGRVGIPGSEYGFAHLIIADADVIVRRDDEAGLPGVVLRLHTKDARSVVETLLGAGVAPVGFDALDALRISNGRPRFGAELDPSVLPKESGQEERAVSYTKGCYCGQEVVARQHYLGNPRKRLVRLCVTGKARSGDTVLDHEGNVLGRIGGLSCECKPNGRRALAVLKGGEHEVGREYVIRAENGSDEGAAVVL